MIKKSITCLASLGQCLIMSCRASSHVCIDYTKKPKKKPKNQKQNKTKTKPHSGFFAQQQKQIPFLRTWMHEYVRNSFFHFEKKIDTYNINYEGYYPIKQYNYLKVFHFW